MSKGKPAEPIAVTPNAPRAAPQASASVAKQADQRRNLFTERKRIGLFSQTAATTPIRQTLG